MLTPLLLFAVLAAAIFAAAVYVRRRVDTLDLSASPPAVDARWMVLLVCGQSGAIDTETCLSHKTTAPTSEQAVLRVLDGMHPQSAVSVMPAPRCTARVLTPQGSLVYRYICILLTGEDEGVTAPVPMRAET